MTKKAKPLGSLRTISQNLKKTLIGSILEGPAVVIITDPAWTIEFVNAAFCRQTGYRPSEVIGQNASLLSAGPIMETCYAKLRDTLQAGKNWTGELQERRKNGTMYWEQALTTPIRYSKKGPVRHFLKIAEDITDRKRLEVDLKRTIDRLRIHEAQLKATCAELEIATRALRRSQAKLRHLSQTDALTGLLNRRGFACELHRAKALAERQGHSIGILIIDIDHFKQINDQHGHVIGDHILKTSAQLFRSLLRASDIICRYGGDEILIALPACDAEATRMTAMRILEAVRKTEFSKGRIKTTVTVSIGAACEFPPQGQTLEKTLKLADQALYCVKQSGRNGLAFWPSGNNQVVEIGEWASFGASAHTPLFRNVFRMLLAMLEAREKNTGVHSRRVAQMAGVLARALELPRRQIERVTQGALLHDIGKIAIPDAILLKRGPLTTSEQEIIRQHPKAGHDILRTHPEFRAIADIVLSHQEHFDGSGYPRGLKGEQICLEARVFAVIDAYDAIRMGRPYCAPRTPEETLNEIQRCRGKQFDPRVVDALVRCQNKIEAVLTFLNRA